MKNAVEFVASKKGHFLADIASRGINKQKELNNEQQHIVSLVMDAMRVKELRENLEQHQKVLLAMDFITFVNTL